VHATEALLFNGGGYTIEILIGYEDDPVVAQVLFTPPGATDWVSLPRNLLRIEKFDIKGDGGTDYVAVEAATGRVFVSRSTHVMVVEGATGKVLADIPNTPGVHGVGFAPKAGHGFTTNSGDYLP
jgi:DNA-binding beta-propeller fold protein YncE